MDAELIFDEEYMSQLKISVKLMFCSQTHNC